MRDNEFLGSEGIPASVAVKDAESRGIWVRLVVVGFASMVPLILAAVALLGCAVPGRRAARIQPIEALRR